MLQNTKPESSTVRIPVFLPPYSIEYSKIRKIMERYVPILNEDERYQSILSRGFKTVSRRVPSLANTLSPSDFVSFVHRGTWLDFTDLYKCGASKCPCCPRLIRGDSFQSTVKV